MLTFAVDEVELGKKMRPLERREAIDSLLYSKAEAVYPSDKPLVVCDDVNALVNAAYHAFYHHYPLVLSPDAVWLTMAQGFALHVNENAEALRARFVRHEGKKTLTTMVDQLLVLGEPFPWTDVVAGFSMQLKEQLGKTRDLVVCDFSTTTLNERVASEIVLMDAFKAYFDYLSLGGCGIPSITLLGTPEDWRSVRTRARALGEYGLETWASAVAPILDEIARTADGTVDRKFWQSFFHWEGGSGPDEVTGWILKLFPKMKDDRPKPGLSSFPSALASVAVRHVNLPTQETFDLKFVGGLFGVTQDPDTLALAPEAGWAIITNTPLHPRPQLQEGDRVRTLRADFEDLWPAGTIGHVVELEQRGSGWRVLIRTIDPYGLGDLFQMPAVDVEAIVEPPENDRR